MERIHAKKTIIRLLTLLRLKRQRSERRARPRLALPVSVPPSDSVSTIGTPSAATLQLPPPRESLRRTSVELGPVHTTDGSLTEAAFRDVHWILAHHRRSDSLDQMIARYRSTLLRKELNPEAIDRWVSDIKAFVGEVLGIAQEDAAVAVIDVRRRLRVAQAAARLRGKLRAARGVSTDSSKKKGRDT